MKICILTPRFPFPENGGDVLRINNIARYLKQQGHQLILVSFTNKQSNLKPAYQLYDKIYTVEHSKVGALIMAVLYALDGQPLQCGYYHSMAFRRILNHVIAKERPEMFIAHLLRMVPYLDNSKTLPHSIVEMTDALSRTYALSTKSCRFSPMQLVYRVENHLIRRYEDYVACRFPKSVLVSKADVHLIQSRVPKAHLVFHTNGVSIAAHPLNKYNPHKICFVGNMRTLQNQEAVLYFVDEILPQLIKQEPQIVFYIIGAQPSARIQRLADNKNIVVTGYVDSVEEVLADACLAVAPVHIAAGIQNKILVAMGQRIPVVLTSLVAKAIPEIENEENAIIADDRKQFAEACMRIMVNTELRNKIAENGYQMIKEHYSWFERLAGYETLPL